ncbi:MAG: hypothetical protein WC511_03220 [Candidatus Pacearchaeota archaeon]
MKKYSVRFEHPYVGNKGECAFVCVLAENERDAIAQSKVLLKKEIKESNCKEYPVKDSYFHAYPDRNGVVGEKKVYDGDERL